MKGRKKRSQINARRRTPGLLPAIAAVGGACSLAATPAGALELGQIQMESTLGQPLRASIAYALGPNEQLFDFCIFLRPNVGDNAIPTVSRARLSLSNNKIILTGNTIVKDPLLNVRVAVDCPYTPHLVREYTLIVDPVLPDRTAPMVANRNPAPAAASQNAVVSPAATPQPAERSVPVARDETPISANTEYRVQTGDTTSTIVARIEGRTIGLWPAVDALVQANPDAFVDGDANRIMAGSVLTIPDMTTLPEDIVQAPVSLPMATEPAADLSEQRTPWTVTRTAEFTTTVQLGETATETTVTEEVAPIEPVTEPAEATVPDPVLTSAPADIADTVVLDREDATDEDVLRPGDVVIAPPVTEPVTEIAPVVEATPTARAETPSAMSGAWSWLFWLAGAGIALILGLLVFGRAIKARFGSVAVAQPEPAIDDDEPTQTNPVLDDVDFSFSEPVADEAVSLDADLGEGTGLEKGAEMDVAQDFGFTADGQASNEMDLEITEEAAREDEDRSTDIIPPSHRSEESSILQSEIPPEMADDDYDMSMIVDATKQTIDEYDATAKDLHAVQVDQEDEYSISDDTLATQADLATLEQDYEDELTATQALNMEIEKAAAELAKRMDEDVLEATVEDPGLEPTAEMPAREHDPEITAEMPARSQDPEITAELTANLPTDIDAENDDIADSGVTSKIVAAGGDVTVEMEVESGKVDTKKKPTAEA